MKNIAISNNDAGKRLDKYLIQYFNKAPASFTYKMIRKKNIKLNGIKANGSEIIKKDDVISLYMRDETIEMFRSSNEPTNFCSSTLYFEPDIVYEDDNLLIVNKPAGILSQKAVSTDISINEICLEYINKTNDYSTNANFTPSICNRLDRNTEGLIVFSKTYICAKELSKAFKERTIHKYYYCIICGLLKEELSIEGYLKKDKDNNIVHISKYETDGSSKIKTFIKPVICGKNLTIAEIELITGKSHQIRAHLASIGFPLLGDYKYGNRKINDKYKLKYGVEHQLLLSHKIIFPILDNELKNLSNKEISIDIPQLYKDIINGNME